LLSGSQTLKQGAGLPPKRRTTWCEAQQRRRRSAKTVGNSGTTGEGADNGRFN